jgi:hypothetical protein
MKIEIAPVSTEIEANWEDAILYCFSLNIDGRTGWRLPTLHELSEILKINSDFKRSWYWSNTCFERDYAMYQCFVSGKHRPCHKINIQCYTRAVRDI